MAAESERFERSIELCEEERFADACDLLGQLVAIDPEDADAWSLLARAEFRRGGFPAALLAADRAAKLAPGSGYPHVIACLALLRLEKPEEATVRARQAVHADPFDWLALGMLAQVLAGDRSTVGESRELVGRILKLAPGDPVVQLMAGRILAAAGDRDAARRAFLEVLRLDPGSAHAQTALAGLRLRRRVNDPAALAEVAAGFARATRVDPEHEPSSLRLELILRVFLSKTSYLLLIDAYAIGRISATSQSTGARLLPVAFLVIPAVYAFRFAVRLTGQLRRRLLERIGRPGPVRSAMVAEAVAVAAVLTSALAPANVRTGCAAVAAVAALLGRLVLHTQVKHAVRAVRGEQSQPAIRPGLLRVVAVLLSLTAVALLVAATKDKAGGGALIGAALFMAGAVAVARAAHRVSRVSG
jgi:tetratricopeptide (TPR) repeat protein